MTIQLICNKLHLCILIIKCLLHKRIPIIDLHFKKIFDKLFSLFFITRNQIFCVLIISFLLFLLQLLDVFTMKSLVLCMLLFLMGTHGHSIAQEQSPEIVPEPPKPGVREYLKNVIHGAFVLGAELVGMLESKDAEIEEHLHKRIESLLVDSYNLFHGIGVIVVDVYKEVDKEIHEELPTYRKEVLPIFVDHVHKAFEYLLSLKDEVTPFIKKANLQMMQIHLQLLAEMKTVYENHKDKLQAIRDEMNAKIKPFVVKVHEEVKAVAKVESEKQLTEEQREKYKDVMKVMVSYREEDSKKLLELLEKFKNEA